MAVRFRKYFKECKPVQCTGRRSRQCPETPKRANGEYKTCGVWCLEFFDDNKQWQSLTFKDVIGLLFDKLEGKTFLMVLMSLFAGLRLNEVLRFHCLRHCFASISSDTGADIVTTKELLGHSDITMIMRYSHKQMDVKRNAIERVTTHILGMGKGKVLPLVAQTGTA